MFTDRWMEWIKRIFLTGSKNPTTQSMKYVKEDLRLAADKISWQIMKLTNCYVDIHFDWRNIRLLIYNYKSKEPNLNLSSTLNLYKIPLYCHEFQLYYTVFLWSEILLIYMYTLIIYATNASSCSYAWAYNQS